METVWVLSMCHSYEDGGDVIASKLFPTRQHAEAKIKEYEATVPSFWGCVDWILDEVEVPRL